MDNSLFTDEHFLPKESSITTETSLNYLFGIESQVTLSMIEWKRLSHILPLKQIYLTKFNNNEILIEKLRKTTFSYNEKQERVATQILFSDFLFFNYVYGDFFSSKVIYDSNLLSPIHYLLLNYLTELNPYFILRLFDIEKCDVLNGKYVIRLFINKEWVNVKIDDYVPVFKGTSKLVFYQPSSQGEIWMILLEKALAKIIGNYIKLFKQNYSSMLEIYEDFIFYMILLTSVEPSLITIDEITSKSNYNIFTFKRIDKNKENNSIFTSLNFQSNNDNFVYLPLQLNITQNISFERNFVERKDYSIQTTDCLINYLSFNKKGKGLIEEFLNSLDNYDQLFVKRKIYSGNPIEKDYSFHEVYSQLLLNQLSSEITSSLMINVDLLNHLNNEEIFIGSGFKLNYEDSYSNIKNAFIKKYYYEINDILLVINTKRSEFKEKNKIILSKLRHVKKIEDKLSNTNKALYVNTICDEESINTLRSTYSKEDSVLSQSYSNSNFFKASLNVQINQNILKTCTNTYSKLKPIKKPKNVIIKIEDIFWKEKLFNNGVFIGELNEENEPDGIGGYYWDSGEYYLGTWRQGQRHGYGIQYYAKNNILYEGEYSNGLRHGVGKLFLANHDYYEGEFIDDYFDGQGAYYWENGSKWIGLFREGYQHGEGLLKTHEGTLLIKTFAFGHPVKLQKEEESNEIDYFESILF